MTPPILITGAARSGTSMVAAIIHRCGAFGGRFHRPSRANPRGIFENAALRDLVVKPYLRACGVDPFCQFPLPTMESLIPFPSLRQVVEREMRSEGWDGRSPWFYKCPKACHMWPIWNAAFPTAQWVIVRREDSAIVNSCLHTAFMRAYDDAEGWQTWVNAHKQRFEEMHSAMPGRVREVWPARFVHGDFVEVESLVHQLGLTWNEAGARQFVDASLWHQPVVKGG